MLMLLPLLRLSVDSASRRRLSRSLILRPLFPAVIFDRFHRYLMQENHPATETFNSRSLFFFRIRCCFLDGYASTSPLRSSKISSLYSRRRRTIDIGRSKCLGLLPPVARPAAPRFPYLLDLSRRNLLMGLHCRLTQRHYSFKQE
jgi:hypothetical protein